MCKSIKAPFPPPLSPLVTLQLCIWGENTNLTFLGESPFKKSIPPVMSQVESTSFKMGESLLENQYFSYKRGKYKSHILGGIPF